jgi:hypothetical protein
VAPLRSGEVQQAKALSKPEPTALTGGLRGSPVELFHKPLALRLVKRTTFTSWGRADLSCALSPVVPIAGSQCDLQLIELVPLGLSSVFFRNTPKLLKAMLRSLRVWFVHRGTIYLVS